MPARASAHAQQQGLVRVRGVVQGVGFRPFVFRLALELGLRGWVRNDGDGVEIAVQGAAGAIRDLLQKLESEPPPLSRVERVEYRNAQLDGLLQGFTIESSRAGNAATSIAPDAAICPDCLAELCDPGNRRYRYPFINCIHCGPRYTITARLPYDRPNTSMAGFAQCPACQAQYEDPADRRFHAQPNACAACGPRLAMLDARGQPVAEGDPIAAALRRIQAGQILAVKGVGGFHLVCDARNAVAVARLRVSKERGEKPFAAMFANAASLAPYALVGGDEARLLESAERPVVLVNKGPGSGQLADIAPGMSRLGVMLPYAPLHYLLFHEAAGRPDGTAWLGEKQDLALLATSANPGGEPLVIGNGEALRRLQGLADAFLVHDRDILLRCDDSVMRWDGQAPRFIRRARGFTPLAVKLPRSAPSVLACGAWYKNTVCLTRGDEAFVSQHIGDLDSAAGCEALEHTALHLMGVLQIKPEIVAHDLHPDFFSSRFAAHFAAEHGLPRVSVQHHHAHIAAVMAERGIEEPVLGLALDGVGLGTDGRAWGGELLRVDACGAFARLGHFRELALPGGDSAAREPWRMAASALHALGRGGEIARRFAYPAAATVAGMLERGFNSPSTSSAGRCFDAAAGLLGVSGASGFEGQAAMRLESLAERHGPVAPLDGGWLCEADGTLNLLPLLNVLADMDDAAYGAALFHATLAHALADWLGRAALLTGLNTVALGGGCFLNGVLSRELSRLLGLAGFRVLQARSVPPNDGGVSLGQAYIAIQESLCV
ncbi:MAG: carbamoyltransferase HypF [Burkholderiales bacterium]